LVYRGAKLENIDNLVLKCGADELVEKVLPVYNKFGDRLNGLKTLEIDVWIDAGKVNFWADFRVSRIWPKKLSVSIFC
jgi:hypothetical protein